MWSRSLSQFDGNVDNWVAVLTKGAVPPFPSVDVDEVQHHGGGSTELRHEYIHFCDAQINNKKPFSSWHREARYAKI